MINIQPIEQTDRNNKRTYYIKGKSLYDETFLSQISYVKHEELTNENIRRAKIIAKLDHSKSLPTLAFNLTEIGPKLVYQDFKELPEIISNNDGSHNNIDTYLQNLGINLMVGLAQGHDYNEGIFEMAAPRMNKHRVMVICSKIRNVNTSDDRLLRGYFQMIIFIPRDILEFLPSFSSIENKIMPLIHNYIPESSYIDANLGSLKDKIKRILTEIVVYYTKYNPELSI